jgi:VanZ family protein
VLRLFLAVAFLIVYVSLYPFDFRLMADGLAPQYLALKRLDRAALRDIGLNIVLYLPLGWTAFLAFRRHMRPAAAFAAACLCGAALSAFVEALQLFAYGRVSTVLDLAGNAAGTAFGALLAPLGTRAAARPHPDIRTSNAILLLWVGWLVFPPSPALDAAQLSRRVEQFWNTPFSVSDAVAGAAEWLIVARLLEDSGLPGTLRPLALLAALVPGRLLISAGYSATWSRVAAAAAALAIWTFLRRFPARTALLACASLAAIAVRELLPFRPGGRVHSFSWLPLSGLLETDRVDAFSILLRSAFAFGSAAWLLRRAGLSYRAAAIALPALVAALQVAQIYLPRRVPDITDPLLAFLAVLAVARLDEPRHASPARI